MSSNASDFVGKSPDRRKLIAVVYADMVGYSRLIGLDDAGTLERLRTLRRNLINPAIDEHGGRIVQTGGDSLLIVFDSIDGAVRCAVKVQQQVPDHDGDQPPDRAIRFRVGINIGDAIADGTDLHGDAVNVAARIQAECPSGGVCVTRAVRDHVQDRLKLAFDELGEIGLKNIARPVEVFVLRLETAATGSVERRLVHGTREALPLPGKPSIAVLAFTNLSDDLDQEYFSDGIADDIITELSRSRSLFVIARNSSFTYKGRAAGIRQVGQELGVRYVLKGSVRRGGDRVRVSAQLIDAEAGNHVWADRYDRHLADVFAVQDEITDAVANAIGPAISQAERQRAMRKPPDNLDAWEAYQRGLWHQANFNAADNTRAVQFFRRAIEQDEMFVAPYVALTVAYYESGEALAMRSFDDAMILAGIAARRAAEIDPQDAEAQFALGLVATLSGRLEEAKECASLALAISPHSTSANTLNGALLIFSGQPIEGRNSVLTAMRLDPREPRGNAARLNLIAMSYYVEGDYAGALEAARRTIVRYPLERYPGNVLSYRWLAAALGQLGRTSEAREALNTATTVAPKAFDLYVRKCVPWHRPEDHEHMLDGLRKAGWQG
jgi:adenylate cyclase